MPEPTSSARPPTPSHPDRVDSQPGPRDGGSWAGFATAIVLGAVLLLIVVLHVTGVVGPGGH